MKLITGSSNAERHEWTESETKLLLDTTAANMEQLKVARNKSKVWSTITDVLIANGSSVTITQCMDRYKYMKRSYKAYVDKSKRSGSGKCSFRYEKEMHALIGDDPAVTPLFTYGSGENTENTDLYADDSDESPCSSKQVKRPRKRSMINELKELMEERDQRLLSAMKEMNNEQNQILKKLIDKL